LDAGVGRFFEIVFSALGQNFSRFALVCSAPGAYFEWFALVCSKPKINFGCSAQNPKKKQAY
jgi:hypothetical protein